MKNFTQKGFVIPLILTIVAILVAGGAYVAWRNENKVIGPVNGVNVNLSPEQIDQYNRSIQQAQSNHTSAATAGSNPCAKDLNDPLCDYYVVNNGSTSTPFITAISPSHGSVGTLVTITGTNLAGFEGDLNAYIQNDQGDIAFLPGIGSVPRTDQTIKVKIDAQLCKQNNSYSGALCTSYMTITPGTYKIYTQPWSEKSNPMLFTVTAPVSTRIPVSINTVALTDTTDWQSYSNPEYGISFQYPVGSKVTDSYSKYGGIYLSINSIDGTYTDIQIQNQKDAINSSPIQTPCNDNGYYTSGILDTYGDIDFIKSDTSKQYSEDTTNVAYAESYCVVHNSTRYTITPRLSWNISTPPDKTKSFITFDQVMSDLQFYFTN